MGKRICVNTIVNELADRFNIRSSSVAKNGLSGTVYESDYITGRSSYWKHTWQYPRIWWCPWRRNLSLIVVRTYQARSDGFNYCGWNSYSSSFEHIRGIDPSPRKEVIYRIKEDILSYEINRLLTEKP